jgi:hypothetical protein
MRTYYEPMTASELLVLSGAVPDILTRRTPQPALDGKTLESVYGDNLTTRLSTTCSRVGESNWQFASSLSELINGGTHPI